ncbi:MAG: TOPRIM nucleotidyl transferase/hydrolase domain-containing protein, partial [Acidimicrobiia bacterium]
MAATEFAVEGGGIPVEALARAMADGMDPRMMVLVEGISDHVALRTLAHRRDRNLDAEGVRIVPMGGATKVNAFLDLLGPDGHDVKLAGLCDAAEEGHFQRGLERAGLGVDLTRSDLEALGFFVCVVDLEDELIRSLGASAVEEVIEAQGQLGSFRSLQNQPAWRNGAHTEQLRRFIKARSGGARQYGRL